MIKIENVGSLTKVTALGYTFEVAVSVSLPDELLPQNLYSVGAEIRNLRYNGYTVLTLEYAIEYRGTSMAPAVAAELIPEIAYLASCELAGLRGGDVFSVHQTPDALRKSIADIKASRIRARLAIDCNTVHLTLPSSVMDVMAEDLRRLGGSWGMASGEAFLVFYAPDPLALLANIQGAVAHNKLGVIEFNTSF